MGFALVGRHRKGRRKEILIENLKFFLFEAKPSYKNFRFSIKILAGLSKP